MRRSKKFLSVVVALAFLIAMFPACNKNSNSTEGTTPNNKSASSTVPEKEVSIEFCGAIAEEMGPKDLLNAFMKENPNIKVTYVFTKNDDAGNTKINTQLMAGSGLDVVVNYGPRRIDARVKAQMFEELTPYLQRDKFNLEENFGKGYYTQSGKIYGIPASTLKQMVYINKNAIQEAGLAMPDDNWTFDDYKEYSIKLTKNTANQKVYGSVWPDAGYHFAWPARGLLGSDYYYKKDGTTNFDHPAFKRSLDLKLELENNLKVQENYIEIKAAKINYYAEFAAGKAAMMLTADPTIRYVKDLKEYPRNWVLAFANVPRFDKDTNVNYAKGRSFFDYISINKRSSQEVKDAAWKLIKFAATEGSIHMFKYGRPSAWVKLDKEKAADSIFTPEEKKLVDMDSFNRVFMDYKSEGYNDTEFTAYPQIDKILQEEYEKTQGGLQTVDQALAAMKKRGDAEIQKEKAEKK